MSLPVLLLACAFAANASDTVRVPPWEFHNSFWMSLHQTLIDDAMSPKPRDLSSLSAAENAAWTASVAAYRAVGGKGDMTFANAMLITNDGLTQVADDAIDPVIDAPLADALKRAAPVYRAHWWAADAKANQFFLTYAAAMVQDAGVELVRQHEAVYRSKFPQHVHVYIALHAGPFGAYTINGRSGGVITTMSSRDAGYQGVRALEMLLHESSHAVVGPNNGTVAAAILAASKQRGLAVPRDLWHAILFATSSELTRRLLMERGVTDFVPSSVELFTRAWPKFREPVEKYWLPYLNGQGTLEEAIDKVVDAIPH